MQVTVRVTRTYADGSSANFEGVSDSIEGAIKMADQLATGKAANDAAAEGDAAVAAVMAKVEAKKSAAKAVTGPSTAKAETKAADAPKETPTVTTSDETVAVEVSYDDVKASILAVSKAKGREPTVAMLQRFGVASGKDLKPVQFADLIAFAAGVLDGSLDPMASCTGDDLS